jgi:aminoacyl tRNA synthase complex-interacting multifunctional protein 1
MEGMSENLGKLDNIIASIESALSVSETQTGTDGVAAVHNATAQDADTPEPNNRKEPEKKPKKEKAAKAVKISQAPAIPDVDAQFLLCDLRVGRITSVGHHEEADGLYVLKIDVGGGELRTVCAGLRKYVPDAEMEGRTVVLICNLKPRKLRGVDSEAMCLAGSVVSGDGEKETVVPIAPPADAEAGALVSVSGVEHDRNVVEGKFLSGKNWDKVVARLSVTDGKACYGGRPLRIASGDIACSLPDGAEIH